MDPSYAGGLSGSRNIMQKVSQIIRFRDNSEDEVRYDPLEDGKPFLEEHGAQFSIEKKTRNGLRLIAYTVVLVLLVISVVLNVLSWQKLRMLSQDFHRHGVEEFDSPVDRDTGTRYHTQAINGSVKKPTLYRQRPSQEVDDAWLALGTNFGSIAIPVEDGPQFGLKEGQVQRVAEQGGGYMADLFVFHDLHCLNLIRQTSHWNWDYYHAKAGTEEAPGTAFEAYVDEDDLWEHFTHCLDMLRQFIMCNANTAVYGQWWVKDKGPDKDFNSNAQCKDFDAILGWYEENHVDMDTTFVRKRPGDIVIAEPT